MMEMYFSFEDYQQQKVNYLDHHSLYNTLKREQFWELEKRQKEQDLNVDRTLEELKKRTTEEYYRKVETSQTYALTFARKVFPSYKFIMPDALTDDWLSTMDWHKKYQTRDHSLHQTLTAYIVSKMLGNGDPAKGLMLSKDESLLSRCATLLSVGGKTAYLRNYLQSIDQDYSNHVGDYGYDWAVEVFYETAMLAAQFHDMGYPWQFINTLAKELTTASYEKISGMLIDEESTYNYIKDRLLIYPFFGYQESDVKGKLQDKTDYAKALLKKGVLRTHGLPGALGFLCLNDTIRAHGATNDKDEATNKLILDWAAVAIMMHDMPGLYWGDGKTTGTPDATILKLDFETDPLSCIVSIADILEEFERPKATFPPKEKDNFVKVGYEFECKGSGIEFDGGHLRIKYFYGTEEERINNATRRKEEVIEYLNLKTGYIDLSSWGVVDVAGIAEVK